jgi:DNA-binding XRE family transcriptional regulator
MHILHLILINSTVYRLLNWDQELARSAQSTTHESIAFLLDERLGNLFKCYKKMVQMAKNALREIRESLLMSKSELAREANISPITITRIEEGKPCRLETKRKILLALGCSLSDSKKIFGGKKS